MKFKDKDFKEAVKWLKENNYPLDLTKHMLDFTVVDLANLLFEAQEVITQDISPRFIESSSSSFKFESYIRGEADSIMSTEAYRDWETKD